MILRLKRRLRENFEKEDKGDPNVETLTNDMVNGQKVFLKNVLKS